MIGTKKFWIEWKENWIKFGFEFPPIDPIFWLNDTKYSHFTSNWMMEPNWRGKIKSFFKCNLYFRVRLLWNFGEMNFFWILARNYLKRDKKIVSISLNETIFILLLPDICKNTISNISSQICWAILSKINSFVFLALCLNKNIQNNIQRQFFSFLNSNSHRLKPD